MSAVANHQAENFAARLRKIALAGSDSHTLARLGCTYTLVQGACNRREFFDGLKLGRAAAFGKAGNYGKLLRAVLEISCGMMGERRWTLALAPLLAVVPVVVLAIFAREITFAQRWGRRINKLADAMPELSR